jgi:RNA polymerase sigma factor (sigma-70 family)
MHEPTDDAELMALCKLGDQRAWRSLVLRHQRLVYSSALSMGLSHADASDVTQTVFIELINGLQSINDDAAIVGWLSTVTRRTVFRVYGGRDRDRDRNTRHQSTATDLDATQDETGRLDDIAWLHQGLLQLPLRCREMLIALYFAEDNVSYESLSEALNIPLGSIGPTRARCLEQLRTILRTSIDID